MTITDIRLKDSDKEKIFNIVENVRSFYQAQTKYLNTIKKAKNQAYLGVLNKNESVALGLDKLFGNANILSCGQETRQDSIKPEYILEQLNIKLANGIVQSLTAQYFDALKVYPHTFIHRFFSYTTVYFPSKEKLFKNQELIPYIQNSNVLLSKNKEQANDSIMDAIQGWWNEINNHGLGIQEFAKIRIKEISDRYIKEMKLAEKEFKDSILEVKKRNSSTISIILDNDYNNFNAVQFILYALQYKYNYKLVSQPVPLPIQVNTMRKDRNIKQYTIESEYGLEHIDTTTKANILIYCDNKFNADKFKRIFDTFD